MNPTGRFTDRAGSYARYRPDYPDEMLAFLGGEVSATPATVIADIGSGTGILTKRLLAWGNVVFAVEPNDEMRAAAELLLGGWPGFRSVKGTAEATTLPACSIDLIVAAQAFHWFDRDKARAEFIRILKPAAWVALAWNTRKTEASPFLREYERLLQRFSIDYRQVDHRNVTEESLRGFFVRHLKRTFPNRQEFDFEGLSGRLLSSSYAPLPGHPDFDPMMSELSRIFETFATGGRVRFEYVTELYLGRML